ncbi:hypothetical protein E8E11_004770 [Didymella keratinophila]|nr:hypothetical protein E8E11_004770 [Didymella keratinophila]
MPPALSDVESSDSEMPATKMTKGGKAKAEPTKEEEDEDEDEEEAGEDEYVVEKILGHRFNRSGTLEFDVKWQGYENPKDRTWEPEANMETAADVLKEYFDEIGGRPEKPSKGTKRKARAALKSETGTPASSSKRSKKAPSPVEWSPPPGSWEHDVSHIDTVEQSICPRTGKEGKFAYIVWNNQKKTQHPLKHIYTKCPQKMLQYYESHLVFTPHDENGANGDAMDKAF